MILAVDVGNSETLIGVFSDEKLIAHWRLPTHESATADELTITLAELVSLAGLKLGGFKGVVLASVVPSLTKAWREMSRASLDNEAVVVEYGVAIGLPIRYEHPQEVGADRIANALAASRLHGNPVIVVDFGTATTFDVVSPEGEYVGGAIAPGLQISAEALFKEAARLAEVELSAPSSVIGTNTRASLQAGILFGKAAMVDGLIRRIKVELEIVSNDPAPEPRVVATGGLADLVVPLCDTPMEVSPFLTLRGLHMIFKDQSNQTRD